VFKITALPHTPEHLMVLEVTFSSVKLAWNSTSNTTSAPVKSFIIRYRRNGSSDDFVEITALAPEILVGGLSADTAYEFHVLADSEFGRSLSAASIIVTTRERESGRAALI